MTREETIDSIVANCPGWDESDREILGGFPDEKLTALSLVPPTSFQDGEREYKYVPENEQWFVRNVMMTPPGEDAEDDDEDDEELDETKYPPIPKPTAKPSKMQTYSKGADQMFDTQTQNRLTAEEQEDLAFARLQKNRIKEGIVARLVANVQDDGAREDHAKRLMGKSLDELQEIAELLPQHQQTDHTPNYYGAAGAISTNRREEDDGTGILDEPVMNFAKAAG